MCHSFNYASQLTAVEPASCLQYNISPHLNAPLSAAVESDTVGYTTIEMQAGKWYQIGTPFVALEDGVTPTLNTVFTDGFSVGDSVRILDPSRGIFIPYYWNQAQNGWSESTRPNAALASVELAIGEAVYIQKASAGVVTLKGKVEATQVEFGTEEGQSWNQVVLVWPQKTSLNEIAWEGMGLGDTLYLLNDGADGQIFVPYYWNTRQNGWCDSTRPNASLVDVDIDVGQAMYINKQTSGTGKLEPVL